MENFFYDDHFCSDLSDLVDYFDFSEEDIEELPEDWSRKVQLCTLEKIFKMEMEYIVDVVLEHTDYWEERFPEDCDKTMEQIKNAVMQSVDIEKLNSLLPSLYYPTGPDAVITKADLMTGQ